MNIDELFDNINTNKLDNICPLWVKELCLEFGKQLLEEVIIPEDRKEFITTVLHKYLSFDIKDDETYWIDYIEYQGYKYWYKYQHAHEGDICLATREPANYCNGFYLYSPENHGNGKLYVVIKHNNPNEKWY